MMSTFFFLNDIERLLPVVRFEHLVLRAFEYLHHRGAVFSVVFDNKNCWSFSDSHKGNSIENVDPLSGWLSTTSVRYVQKRSVGTWPDQGLFPGLSS